MSFEEIDGTRLIFLTGPPRTGKSTVLLKVAESLRAQHYRVGGMTSREIREKGTRVGFEIRDYATGRTGWLAHIRQPTGPRVGKYRVNLDDLQSIGSVAIETALEDADIVLIDEIGPMELLSERFRKAVQKAIDGSKPVLGTIHYRVQHPLVRQVKSREDAAIVDITQESRSPIVTLVAKKVTAFLKASVEK
jgi:nucleoside-triphosphatase